MKLTFLMFFELEINGFYLPENDLFWNRWTLRRWRILEIIEENHTSLPTLLETNKSILKWSFSMYEITVTDFSLCYKWKIALIPHQVFYTLQCSLLSHNSLMLYFPPNHPFILLFLFYFHLLFFFLLQFLISTCTFTFLM